jgi:hypothetical protein
VAGIPRPFGRWGSYARTLDIKNGEVIDLPETACVKKCPKKVNLEYKMHVPVVKVKEKLSNLNLPRVDGCHTMGIIIFQIKALGIGVRVLVAGEGRVKFSHNL